MSLFDKILAARGLKDKIEAAAFLSPDYSLTHDPFLLPDMDKATNRLMAALRKQEKIVIYGDYDIDGLTSSALLFEALTNFGFHNLDVFIPDRFVEGYGMTIDAIKKLAKDNPTLIITVDCGSLNGEEITYAKKIGIDIIVTDHHGVSEIQPPAIAVINPKRIDSKYPFSDLAGVGVVFKLVQAMQTKFDGMSIGQEKWLLDLVALGTVCDVVPLVDENRIFVYWGLKVLAKARRHGLKALMQVAMIDTHKISARSLGFGLGPRLNAVGRLENAKHAFKLLTCNEPTLALQKAQYLDELNKSRQFEQKNILKEAIMKADQYTDDPVLVLSDVNWNHGIVGIVASKLLEKYKKPVFVFQEMGDLAKGSARSFGDFNLSDAINFAEKHITSGGGHKLAAGVSLPTENINIFRKCINNFYNEQKLVNQLAFLLPVADVAARFSELDEALVDLIAQLEPFGNSNPQPVFRTDNLGVVSVKKMGDNKQHIKITLINSNGKKMDFLAFGAPDSFFVEVGTKLSAWYHIGINEWQGRRTLEGKLLHIELSK